MNIGSTAVAIKPVWTMRGENAFRRISIALFLAGFSTFSLIYCTQPLLPEFSKEFLVDPAVSSLALSLTTGCLAFSILCAGAFSEALGRKGLMFASICSAAILNLWTAFAPNWEMLLVLRALEGLVLGGVPAVAMAYLAEEINPRHLGYAMGLYVGGTAFGGMIGRVAIGVITELTSWRTALGAMAIVDLIVAVGFLVLLPKSRNFVPRPGLNIRMHLDAWGGHLRHSNLPFLFLAGFLAMGTFVTIYNYAGFRLAASPYNLNQSEIGLIFLAYIFGVGASSTAGAVADRLGRPPVIVAGALMTIAALALTLLPGIAAMIAGIVVTTIGFFMIHSVASGWVGRLASRNKSHAASLYLLAYYLGSSAMGSLGGWFWNKGGWSAVIGFTSVLTALILGIAIYLMQQTAQLPHPGRA